MAVILPNQTVTLVLKRAQDLPRSNHYIFLDTNLGQREIICPRSQLFLSKNKSQILQRAGKIFGEHIHQFGTSLGKMMISLDKIYFPFRATLWSARGTYDQVKISPSLVFSLAFPAWQSSSDPGRGECSQPRIFWEGYEVTPLPPPPPPPKRALKR